MGRLLEFAAWILAESGRAEGTRVATLRMTTAALCAGLAAVLILAALGCAAAALWTVTVPWLGPVGAPLVVAATLSTAAMSLAAAAWFIMRRGRRRPDAAMAPQFLLSEAVHLFNKHPGVGLLAAVVAGMAVANGSRKS